MMQIQSPESLALEPRLEAIGPRPADTGSVGKYWQMLMKHKRTVIFFSLLGLLLGIGISLLITPLYRARTSIEVQDVNENFLYSRQFDPNAGASTYSAEFNLPTQVRLLKSDHLVRRAVDKLHLYNPSKTSRPSPLARLFQLFEHTPASAKGNVTGADRISAYAAAQSHLTVQIATQLAAQTRMLEIMFDNPDPQAAADFANTLANEFIADNVESKLKTAQTTNQWLTKQMEDFKGRLQASEAALQGYTDSAGLVFTGELSAQNVANDKLKQLQSDLSVATADRISKQARYELAKKAAIDSLPEMLDDPGLREDQGRLTDLRRQVADLNTTLLPTHYKVLRLQAQISSLESGLAKKRQQILDRMADEYQSAVRREGLLASAFGGQTQVVSGQSTKMIRYDMLRREVDANRRLYEDLLQKVSESSIAIAMRSSNLRVVDVAEKPNSPNTPKIPLNAGLGFGVGLFAGVAAVFLREGASTRIDSPGAAPHYLNIPELGIVPETSRELLRASRTRHLGSSLKPTATELTVFNHNRLVSDCFRSAFTSILYGSPEESRIISISSSVPQEGKTTVATNLAIAATELYGRVLLIDADLRCPRLHSIFELGDSVGLTELLAGNEPVTKSNLKRYIQETHVPALSVMPAGRCDGNPVKMLHGDRFRQVLHQIRNDFDYVFIDTPPMLHIPDARIIAKASDGVVLVIRANQTTREIVTTVRDRFLEDKVKLLGTILNYWDSKHSGNLEYYYAIQSEAKRA